jgi:hypothetical protein
MLLLHASYFPSVVTCDGGCGRQNLACNFGQHFSASSATLMLQPTTLVRRAKLSERQPGNSLTVSLQGVTAFDPNTLLIPCSSSLKAWKDGRKSVHDKHLNRKFPLFTAPFPAGGAKSCDYGQDLQKSWLATEKFAAKFPAPGNLKRADSRILLVGIHK